MDENGSEMKSAHQNFFGNFPKQKRIWNFFRGNGNEFSFFFGIGNEVFLIYN